MAEARAALFAGPIYVFLVDGETRCAQSSEEAEALCDIERERGRSVLPFKYGGVWVAIEPAPSIEDILAVVPADMVLSELARLVKHAGEAIDSAEGFNPSAEMMVLQAKASLENAAEEERHIRMIRDKRAERGI